MATNWPFTDPPETEVITLRRIVRGEAILRLVTHDGEEDDGGWQFLDGEHVFEEDGAIASLGEMVQFDPTILDLADLPAGSYAWRAGAGEGWSRREGEPPASLDS